MKKIVTLSMIALMFTAGSQLVLAQGKATAPQAGTQQKAVEPMRVQDPTVHEDVVMTEPQGIQQGQGQKTGTATPLKAAGQGINQASQSLNRVVERTNNPEIGQQVRTMVESHQQIQTKNQEAIQTMSQRNNALKFFLGPDYKNAGQVRSNIVSLRNNIAELETLKETADEEDLGDIQMAIDELQTEADSLDTQLEEELSGFSLFGWLAKRFAN